MVRTSPASILRLCPSSVRSSSAPVGASPSASPSRAGVPDASVGLANAHQGADALVQAGQDLPEELMGDARGVLSGALVAFRR